MADTTEAQSRKIPLDVAVTIGVLLPVAIGSLTWRFTQVPWDLGGCFFQVWFIACGLGATGFGKGHMKKAARILFEFILIPSAIFVEFGSVYFPPQVLFPAVWGCIVIAAFAWFVSTNRLANAILVLLLLIPCIWYFSYFGVPHIRQIEQIRGLDAKQVTEVYVESPDKETDLTVTDPSCIASIVESLRHTSPYSPNHERIDQPRHVVVHRTDGSEVRFQIGRGNRAHPNTVWIEFDIGPYQNPRLYRVLEQMMPSLWN